MARRIPTCSPGVPGSRRTTLAPRPPSLHLLPLEVRPEAPLAVLTVALAAAGGHRAEGGRTGAKAGPARSDANAGRAGTAPCILVVDDEPSMLELTCLLLREEFPHATVVAATNGPDGLRAAQQQPPDLVVSDYRMPGMDGIEFLSRLTGVAAPRRILLTAIGDPAVRERAREAGVGAFVAKTVGPDDLFRAVRAALQEDGHR